MGSRSDWSTMKESAAILEKLGIPHECRVVSAHRTPDLLADYAKSADARGLRCIIAGAGGAAHLPGMVAAHTHLPVLGVPVESQILRGQDSLLSIVQMPAGIPVATFAIGIAGAKNAALFAASLLSQEFPTVKKTFSASDPTRPRKSSPRGSIENPHSAGAGWRFYNSRGPRHRRARRPADRNRLWPRGGCPFAQCLRENFRGQKSSVE